MVYKVIILFIVVTAGQAQILKHTAASAPLDYTSGTPYAYGAHTLFTATSGDHYYDPNPSYEFNYSVNDAVTGDSKTQSESRQGDVVQGSYSFIEADGSRRVVDYTADPVSGFNAAVHKEPAVGQAAVRAAVPVTPAAVASPVPVVAPAPVTVARDAPIGYATHAYAPLAASSYATPAIASNSFASPYSSYAY